MVVCQLQQEISEKTGHSDEWRRVTRGERKQWNGMLAWFYLEVCLLGVEAQEEVERGGVGLARRGFVEDGEAQLIRLVIGTRDLMTTSNDVYRGTDNDVGEEGRKKK